MTDIATFEQTPNGWPTAPARAAAPAHVPYYLSAHYWWAYVHPRAVKVFERQWLVNLILWGNYPRLSRSALNELGEELPGATLQVACVYGDLTGRLCARAAAGGGRIDIVDVLPIQLANLRSKLPPEAPARLLPMNSADLGMPAASYDRALLFFLLHEQPRSVRQRTLAEVARVVKPGGKIVLIDYARPRWWNPLRYLWGPVLALLEPFALDLWRHDVATWLPSACRSALLRRSFFGGLYQQIVISNGE
jgi:ubiquinone/menaquinone biosynthesis C-methylase UbiE